MSGNLSSPFLSSEDENNIGGAAGADATTIQWTTQSSVVDMPLPTDDRNEVSNDQQRSTRGRATLSQQDKKKKKNMVGFIIFFFLFFFFSFFLLSSCSSLSSLVAADDVSPPLLFLRSRLPPQHERGKNILLSFFY
jgi:hypothetical protein